MRLPAYSTILAPGGIKMPASGRAKDRSGARQSRKVRHRLAETEYMVPGGPGRAGRGVAEGGD